MASFPAETKRWARGIKRRIAEVIQLQTQPEQSRSILEELVRGASASADAFHRLFISDLSAPFRIQSTSMLFTDKKRLADTIYHGLEFAYGFEECLATGQYAPWPHELSMVNCGSQAMVDFAAEIECDMDPVLVEVAGFQREGETGGATHSLTIVKVEGEDWAIDQAQHALGPITWDLETNTYRVKNKIREDKEETFRFLYRELYTEDEYVDRIQYLRSPEGAASMLICGQRVNSPKMDRWKAHIPLHTSCYIRYDPDTRSILTSVGFDRPLIQNRGLEHRITLNNSGDIQEEVVTGYYYSELGWAEFIDKFPLVTIPSAKVPDLIRGLKDLSVNNQVAFEDRVMSLFQGGSLNDSDSYLAEAIQASYQALEATRFGEAARMISIVEALYQCERRTRDSVLVYHEADRTRVMEQWRDEDANVDVVLRAMKHFKRKRKQLERIRRVLPHEYARLVRSVHVLDADHVEDPEVKRYLSIRDPLERLTYMLEHQPHFFDEAVDRRLFVKRRVEEYAEDLPTLETHARSILGESFERSILSGYARIFAEFLGHLAGSWEHLSLSKYRETTLDKVRSYKKPF
ncbi:MAG: hypothetical protein AABX70_02485 [Nanoarchaeota archaeon]